jgi:hypothetical protein
MENDLGEDRRGLVLLLQRWLFCALVLLLPFGVFGQRSAVAVSVGDVGVRPLTVSGYGYDEPGESTNRTNLGDPNASERKRYNLSAGETAPFRVHLEQSDFKYDALQLLRVSRAGMATNNASKVEWIDEGGNLRAGGNPGMGPDAYAYQSGAQGARSNAVSGYGQAPALRYTKANGDSAIAKFDGFDGTQMIDRKLSIVTTAKAEAQALRQATALSQNGMTAVWEVPTAAQAARAQTLLSRAGATNISVKVGSKMISVLARVVVNQAILLEFGPIEDDDLAVAQLESLSYALQSLSSEERERLSAAIRALAMTENNPEFVSGLPASLGLE